VTLERKLATPDRGGRGGHERCPRAGHPRTPALHTLGIAGSNPAWSRSRA